MPWTDEAVETLIELWKQGLTTVEISKIIGVSKNSVIGKVHRLGLPKRPSPIKQKSTTKAPKKEAVKPAAEKEAAPKKETKKVEVKEETKVPKVEVAPKKAPKIEVKEEVVTPVKEAKKVEVKEEIPSIKESKKTFTPTPKSVQKDFKENISLIELESQSCRWPFGDPKDEGFHFCGKKVLPGQTYCPEHNERAYVKQLRKS